MMTTVERCQPFLVRMVCGHVEVRMMREATAGMPWTPDAMINAPTAKCAVCRGEGTALPHMVDTNCAVDDHDLCIVCDVHHGDPCPDCKGRGYHFPGCPHLKTQNVFVTPNAPRGGGEE